MCFTPGIQVYTALRGMCYTESRSAPGGPASESTAAGSHAIETGATADGLKGAGKINIPKIYVGEAPTKAELRDGRIYHSGEKYRRTR
jgi:hypothetical protein